MSRALTEQPQSQNRCGNKSEFDFNQLITSSEFLDEFPFQIAFRSDQPMPLLTSLMMPEARPAQKSAIFACKTAPSA